MSSSWSTTTTIDFEELGGVPHDDNIAVQWHNGRLLNVTLQNIAPNTLLIIDGLYYLMGGIYAEDITNVTIRLDGQLVFSTKVRQWPRWDSNTGRVMECIQLMRPQNLLLTSSTVGGGVLNGRGWAWWHMPVVGYLLHAEDRPRLLVVGYSKNLLMENWILMDPPLWSSYFFLSDGLEIRYSGVIARRTSQEDHTLEDMSAFNTDGFDVSGNNVYIHDCNIWCQDDAITVKDGSGNMVFENINTSGIGLVIGSIGRSSVNNITFRDIYMYKPMKGIYMKFRGAGSHQDSEGQITNVLVENVVMDGPLQWPIWIGPAQQSDSRSLCHPNPCSLCWPQVPWAECYGEKNTLFENITLRNVMINRPKQSPGVILADEDYPMKNILFDDVRVLPRGRFVANNDESFPLLRRYDRFALNNNVAADRHVAGLRVVVGVASVAAIAGLWKVWTKSSVAQLQKAGGAILVVAVAIAATFAPTAIRVTKYDEFFECSNVIGGVATGETWPIPSCFYDNSTIDSDAVKYYVTPPWVISYLNLSVFFIGAGSIGVYSLHRCIASRNAEKERNSSDAMIDWENDISEQDGVYVQMENIQPRAPTLGSTQKNLTREEKATKELESNLPHCLEGSPVCMT